MENLQPKLRFPEFDNPPSLFKLKDLTLKIGDGLHSTPKYDDLGMYYFINGNNLKDGIIFIDEKTKKVNEEEFFKHKKNLSTNTILLSINGTIGNLAFYNSENVILGKSACYINTDENCLKKEYLYYQLKTRRISKYFDDSLTGSTIKNLGLKSINNTDIITPSLQEQTKIADFLGAVDKQLDILNQKKEKLNLYKKGLMQQLFSQQIRFKDDNGNDFPDWQEKNLGEIGFFQTSSVDKLSRENEREIYLVNYMNVYRHEIIDNTTIKSFQVVTAKDNQIISCNLLKGDILFTPSSETPSDIGHSVVIFEDVNNAVFSYHLMRFRPKIELNLMYSHYFCNIPKVLNQLTKYATGSTRFTISVKSFSKVLVDIPSIEEQTKIAEFLSAIDKQIETVENQITKTETYKKGLLQQMFV
ncbi:restriction endonuclease subunit S [Empedobacter falsenii]